MHSNIVFIVCANDTKGEQIFKYSTIESKETVHKLASIAVQLNELILLFYLLNYL
jgi:hypothetical protein